MTTDLIETPTELTTTEPMNPMTVLERAVSGGADIETLERLIDLSERWKANEARRAFESAMSDLRSDLPDIVKTQTVDFSTSKGRTHYQYEDLATIAKQLSPVLAKHHLSFRWRTDSTKRGFIAVTCILAHADGHSEETTLEGPYDNSGNKNPIQAIGSVTTYLQRYTLKAAIGVAAASDDDGRQGGDVSVSRPENNAPAESPLSEHKCKSCGARVYDKRAEHAANDRKPAWSCSSNDCPGGKGNYSWGSWNPNEFDEPEDIPQESPSDEPQRGPHAQRVQAMMKKLRISKSNAKRWLSAIMRTEVKSLDDVFSDEAICETLIMAVNDMKQKDGWTNKRLADVDELEADMTLGS